MRLAAVVLLAVTTPALADEPEPPCRVRIVRAPADVRAAIEARIGIEPTCTKLDVRVIPTRDGYYVVATPPSGELFEGAVREPGLVGELVTSWARLPHADPYEDEHEDDAEPAAPPPVVGERPPSATPVLEARAAAPPRTRGGSRELAIGMTLTDAGYGVRGELDLLTGRGFSLGIALGVAASGWRYGDAMAPSAELAFRDVRAVLVGAKTFGSAAWRLRAQAGIGLIHTAYAGTVESSQIEQPVEGDGVTTMTEAAVTVSRELASRWALSVGALLTYYAQTYELQSSFAPTREYDIAGVLQLRRRL